VWSCAWNEDDRNYFFAGQQNGLVTLYDMRNTHSAVDTYNTEGSRSPAVSLAYVPISPTAGLMK
jgi:E3 ubiquitin-protein ligase RFWD3